MIMNTKGEYGGRYHSTFEAFAHGAILIMLALISLAIIWLCAIGTLHIITAFTLLLIMFAITICEYNSYNRK